MKRHFGTIEGALKVRRGPRHERGGDSPGDGDQLGEIASEPVPGLRVQGRGELLACAEPGAE
jgi:hypothetical protein